MKIFYKKIISMVLILSVLSGVLIMPASATGGAAVDYVQTELWKLLTFNYKEMDVGLLFWKNLLKSFLAPGKTEANATSVDWQDAYKTGYLAGVNKSLGTSRVGKDGFVLPLYPTGYEFGPRFTVSSSTYPNYSTFPFGFFFAGTTDSLQETSYGNAHVHFGAEPCDNWKKGSGRRQYRPTVDMHISTFVDFQCSGAAKTRIDNLNNGVSGVDVLVGQSIYLPSVVFDANFWSATYTYGSVSAKAYLVCTPSAGYDVNTYTDAIGGSGSRFGGFGGGSSGGGGAGRDLPYIGKKDDAGKLTAVSGAVFDEAKGTYMNPFDGVVKNVKSWTYDYTTRAYTLTLADDSKVLLTYGDDNVTIVEGGKTYTFYYLIPAAVTPSPSPSVPPVSPSPSVPPVSPSPGCNHVYTDKILQKPTCTVAGSMERSCSLCGGSIIDKIPASGHDWLLTNSVADVLGADGKVVTEGYDLYKCSVCHLEYKDFARTGPPGKDVGNSISKLITDLFDSLGVLIGKGIDWLLSLGTKAMAGFTQVTDFFAKQAALVGGFGGGFLLFLSSAFALIPPELLACITFALICAVLGMVAKLVFLK